MNTKAIAITALIFSAFIISGCQTTKPQTTQWEYKVMSSDIYLGKDLPWEENPLQQKLNGLGKDGWELESVQFHSDQKNQVVVVLKREK